jgi:hypothetical protein
MSWLAALGKLALAVAISLAMLAQGCTRTGAEQAIDKAHVAIVEYTAVVNAYSALPLCRYAHTGERCKSPEKASTARLRAVAAVSAVRSAAQVVASDLSTDDERDAALTAALEPLLAYRHTAQSLARYMEGRSEDVTL